MTTRALVCALSMLSMLACDGTSHSDDAGAIGSENDGSPARDATAPPDGSSPSGLWVLGYYPGYQRDLLPPSEIDFGAMTHVVAFSLLPRHDGSIDTTLFIDETQGPALARELAQRAHDAGIHALITVGGAGWHDQFVAAASDANRARFVDEIVRLAREFGYDGVDLDWEPVLESDKPLLLAFVRAIRERDPGLVITVPVGWTNRNFEPVADAYYAELAQYVDRLAIMSYGMSGPWDGWTAWHSSALEGETGTAPTSIAQSVGAYRAAGVAAAKLGFGIGFYGQCWTGVTEPG